jgi:dolichol kinase
MNGALKAAWALTAFVIVAGLVLWLTTGRPVFAVFIVLGVLTAVGAAVALRTSPEHRTSKEDPAS